MSTSVDHVRRLYDALAGRYDHKIRLPERVLFGDGRQCAAGLARGRTLEVAPGTGRNLPHYDEDVPLTLVDVSERMLELASERAARLGRQVEVVVGDALAPVRAVQRALEPLCLRLEADHLLRRPEKRVLDEGLMIEQCERSKLGLVLRLSARRT